MLGSLFKGRSQRVLSAEEVERDEITDQIFEQIIGICYRNSFLQWRKIWVGSTLKQLKSWAERNAVTLSVLIESDTFGGLSDFQEQHPNATSLDTLHILKAFVQGERLDGFDVAAITHPLKRFCHMVGFEEYVVNLLFSNATWDVESNRLSAYTRGGLKKLCFLQILNYMERALANRDFEEDDFLQQEEKDLLKAWVRSKRESLVMLNMEAEVADNSWDFDEDSDYDGTGTVLGFLLNDVSLSDCDDLVFGNFLSDSKSLFVSTAFSAITILLSKNFKRFFQNQKILMKEVFGRIKQHVLKMASGDFGIMRQFLLDSIALTLWLGFALSLPVCLSLSGCLQITHLVERFFLRRANALWPNIQREPVFGFGIFLATLAGMFLCVGVSFHLPVVADLVAWQGALLRGVVDHSLLLVMGFGALEMLSGITGLVFNKASQWAQSLFCHKTPQEAARHLQYAAKQRVPLSRKEKDNLIRLLVRYQSTLMRFPVDEQGESQDSRESIRQKIFQETRKLHNRGQNYYLTDFDCELIFDKQVEGSQFFRGEEAVDNAQAESNAQEEGVGRKASRYIM